MDVEVREVIWLDAFVEKLWRKHHVSMDNVEEVLSSRPQVRRVARGDVAGEDVMYTQLWDRQREGDISSFSLFSKQAHKHWL